MKLLIDADGTVLGRMASVVAKKLIHGYKVEVVNIEKSAILGKKKDIVSRYKAKIQRGHPYAGPFVPRPPHLLAKRIVRGMLPKGPRGKELLKNVRFHIGNPTNEKGQKLKHSVTSSNYWRYTTLGDLAVILGAKKRW
jgi:large subunit ribosomal protein L13